MIRRMIRAVLLAGVAACCLGPRPGSGQEPPPNGRLRLFLDCSSCDFDFIRTEIPWVDYMRDRQDADLHVLVTSQNTGAGGHQYVLNFIGLGPFANHVDTLTWTSGPDDTEDIRRQGLARVLALGLVAYIADTPLASRVRVVVEPGPGGPVPAGPAPVQDPWNYWVFNVRAGGEFQEESRERDRGANLELGVNRTTEVWKLDFSVEGSYEDSKFEIDSATTITSVQRDLEANLLLVRSVNAHVSVGFETGAESSTYGNVETAFEFGPAVEFNVFPYSESTRRALTALYSIGVRSADYQEVTIFDELSETRPAHSLFLGYSTRQPWGSVSASVNLAQYLHDTSKNRVSFGGNMDVRLFRGFSFDVWANYSKVKDQLSIPKEGATQEEILLRLKELQTDFELNMDIGLNYRFGSSVNNIVNPRFRRDFGGGHYD